MQPFPIVKQIHEELLGEVMLLQSLVTEDRLASQDTASLAHQKLCHLMVTIKTYLAEEEKDLYPQLLTHSNPELKTLAWHYIGNQQSMNKMFNAYVNKLEHCQYKFTPALINDTQTIMDIIIKRLESERDILFPQLESMDSRA